METTVRTKIFSALAKAQGLIKPAIKSSENPFFKSKYADLEEVIAAIQDPISKNGISVFFEFKTEILENNPVNYIRYHLCHESGETFVSEWVIMLMKDKTAHGFGGAATYYKRQLLKGIFNLSEIEDDGNSISLPPTREVKNYAPQTAAASKQYQPRN
jgi:hypothetical protein